MYEIVGISKHTSRIVKNWINLKFVHLGEFVETDLSVDSFIGLPRERNPSLDNAIDINRLENIDGLSFFTLRSFFEFTSLSGNDRLRGSDGGSALAFKTVLGGALSKNVRDPALVRFVRLGRRD